jgi:hypothetical protein
MLVLAFCGTALAWPQTFDGKPSQFDPGNIRGYFIWHESDGWKLWTTTKGAEHQFTGDISTDGTFADVQGRKLESKDSFKVGPEKHRIKYDFITKGKEDGITFEIDGGDQVSFDLSIDGHQIDPSEIYVGHDGLHPDKSNFSISRKDDADTQAHWTGKSQ